MIQIAICDDNHSDLLYLRNMLQEILNEYSVQYDIQCYDSGEKLLEAQFAFHLIFLDIIMKDSDGINIGKQIYQKDRSAKVIFQTYYGEYCQAAINQSHAFAFLEKPIQADMIKEQIVEFIENKENVQGILVKFKNVRYVVNDMEREKPSLSIPVKEIEYFEYIKAQREVKIVTSNGIYICSEIMKKLEERMQPLGFETSSRGILVNLEKVVKIIGYTVFLSNGTSVPLSQRRVVEFKKRINEHIHNSW